MTRKPSYGERSSPVPLRGGRGGLKTPSYGLQSPISILKASIIVGLSVFGFFSSESFYSYLFLTPVFWGVLLILLLAFQSTSRYRNPLRDRVVELSKVKPADTVLDVGTGRGLMAIGFAKKAGKVYAIDRWRHRDLLGNTIARSKRNASIEGVEKKIVFGEGDPRKLPFRDKTFDIVVCNYAILNLPHGGRKAALGEMVRVLKPKGRILVADVMDFTRGSKRAFSHALREFGVKNVSAFRFDISTVLVGVR